MRDYWRRRIKVKASQDHNDPFQQDSQVMLHVFRDIDDGIFQEVALKLESRLAIDMQLQFALHLLVVVERLPRAYEELVESVIIGILAHLPSNAIFDPFQADNWKHDLIHVKLQPREIVTSGHKQANLLIFGHDLSQLRIALQNLHKATTLSQPSLQPLSLLLVEV